MISNIIIVGVGGQGALLASRILGALALRLGRDVKVSEVHGMAQRGGSVITHVRIGGEGDLIHAPLVAEGEAGAVIAFEPLEALRALPYLIPKRGLIITNTRPIPPMSVLTGAAKYPSDVMESLTASPDRQVAAFDAQALAEKHKAPRAVNIALLGALAAHPILRDETTDEPVSLTVWESAVADAVPPKTLESNLAVFRDSYYSSSSNSLNPLK
ncbi:MAG: indolepyruvate oxidoreductase subunit beta [Oscillospiraceae bacterium]|jgi:indolepyruvate ferredoxin oxidoreductase beta subunit|nr:indolepyruvate oxidoreductase subunit beta [Oscillospiraceae bacterium]